jgi:hypothetical protein
VSSVCPSALSDAVSRPSEWPVLAHADKQISFGLGMPRTRQA